jgi:hypothetical protein
MSDFGGVGNKGHTRTKKIIVPHAPHHTHANKVHRPAVHKPMHSKHEPVGNGHTRAVKG